MINANPQAFFRKAEVRYAALGAALGLLFALVGAIAKSVPGFPAPLGFLGFWAWPGAFSTMFLLGNRSGGAVPPELFFTLFNVIIYGALFALAGFCIRKSGRSGRGLMIGAVLGMLVLLYLVGIALMQRLYGAL